jgi:hypothetical protein
MIGYGTGYSSSWRVTVVDPETWAGFKELPGFLSASVSRDASTHLLESGSASFDVESPEEGEFWGRVEMLADSGGEVERTPVATMLFSPSRSEARIGRATAEYECRSILAPAEDRVMLAGDYAPKGADGASWAASLLSSCTPAPIYADGSFSLSDHVVFAKGTTYLEAAWMVVDAAGWCIRVTEDGEAHVCQKPEDPTLVLDTEASVMLGQQVGYDYGLSDVPNRYIAVDGEQDAIATDDDPSHPTSTANRGRFVDVYDESVTRVDGESLQMYADRKLKEATAAKGTMTYEREWKPGVTCFDMVRASIPSVGLVGDMRIVQQSVEVGKGAKVTETVEVMA